MANSWNGPQLGSPIRTDVPELQKKLIALLKQNPTSVANIPSDAKRLVNTSGTQWQVQQYNGSSWAAIGKLMHDVDKLDGYHAAITPNANTVAVRNADKKLEGDITGNAATASSAVTLSETLPVNKGGTGATTSAQARTNLGVPPTSHASSSTTYGLATDTKYGHVRSDGDTTKIVAGEVVVKDVAIGGDQTDLASGRGQIGDTPWIRQAVIDFNTYTRSGAWWVTWDDKALNAPETDAGVNGLLVVYAAKGLEGTVVRQFFYRLGIAGTTDKYMWTRSITSSVTEWGPWYRINNSSRTIVDVDSQSDNTSVVGMPFGIYGKGVDGVKRILFPFRFVPGKEYGNGLVIDTGGLVVVGGGESGRTVANGLVREGLSGEYEQLFLTSDSHIKLLYNQNGGYDPRYNVTIFTNGTFDFSATYPRLVLKSFESEKGVVPSENKYIAVSITDKSGGGGVTNRFGSFETGVLADGSVKSSVIAYINESGNTASAALGVYIEKTGKKYGVCPTPAANANNDHIATTEWVRNYALPTGVLIPSLATSMVGYLLCNGAAVSRTTYANLFSIIGTKFGEGDGSTTFNLPDFRNKTLWGAKGNLMSILAAGLPNAEGSVTAMADRTRWVSFRSFSGAIQAAGSNNPAVSDEYYTHYIGGYNGFTVNLSKSNSIYGNSTTVQPPAIAVNIFIKY